MLVFQLISCLVLGVNSSVDDCNIVNFDNLEKKLKSISPDLKAVDIGTVRIFWNALLSPEERKCLNSCTLSVGKKVIQTYGRVKNTVLFDRNEPFNLSLEDICVKDFNPLYLKYQFQTGTLSTEKFMYVPPNYYDRNSKILPPYCLQGRNLSVSLLDNIIVEKKFRVCMYMVEICSCRLEHDCEDCKKIMLVQNKNYFNEPNFEIVPFKMLRITYFRINPEKHSNKISHQKYLNLIEGHCDDAIPSE